MLAIDVEGDVSYVFDRGWIPIGNGRRRLMVSYPNMLSDTETPLSPTDFSRGVPGIYVCPDVDVPEGRPTRIEDYRPLIAERMNAILVTGGAFDPVYRHVLSSPGKRIRSAMAIACARLVPSTESVSLIGVVDVACGMEMLHEASLIHDDVCDGSLLRRSRPSVPAAFGVQNAVHAGFHMAGTALNVVAKVMAEYPSVFVRLGDAAGVTYLNTLSELSLGQLVETMPPILDDTALRRHYDIVARAKTGTLFRLACSYGGTAGAVDDDGLRSLMDYADHLALAFQIMDDVRDVEGGPSLGKDACGDLDRRVVTWPVIEWLDMAAGAHAAWEAAGTPSSELQADLVNSGATARAREAAIHASERACAALAGFPPSCARDHLSGLAMRVVGR